MVKKKSKRIAKASLRSFLNNVKGWKWRTILRAVFYIFLGVFAYVLISNDLVNIQVERRLASDELVKSKPPIQAVITSNSPIYDLNKSQIGELFKYCAVYLESLDKNDGHFLVTTYGWIWSESTSDLDESLILKNDENIRSRANTEVIGRLKESTIVKKIYKNESGSWYLFSLQAKVPENVIQVINSAGTKPGFWARQTEPRTIVSVTSKNGGIPVVYNIGEPSLFFIFLLLMAVVGGVRLRSASAKTGKGLLLEIFKSILQVGAGVLIAFLVVWLGIK